MATINKSGVSFKVLGVLKKNPSIPYSAIGDMVGVSRERVRQIARQNGYPPRAGISTSKSKLCPVCGKTFHTRNIHCSSACSRMAMRKRIVVNCNQCGKSIERTPGTMRNKSGRYFCSRFCFGGWIGNNHSKATKYRKPTTGNFEHEIGSREEFPVKGKVLSPEVKEIYDALFRSSENELVRVRNSNKHKLRKLRIAIKRKAKRQGINNAREAYMRIDVLNVLKGLHKTKVVWWEDEDLTIGVFIGIKKRKNPGR